MTDTYTPVLTDAEIEFLLSFGCHPMTSVHAIGRAIEQAVLQSPEVQAWKKDASLAAEYRKLLEGSAAVLENCADDMEDEGDEIGAHEARSMANVINAAMETQP